MDDDRYSFTVKVWPNVIVTQPSPTLRYTIAGEPGEWIILLDGATARVDGGDPGDEDDTHRG